MAATKRNTRTPRRAGGTPTPRRAVGKALGDAVGVGGDTFQQIGSTGLRVRGGTVREELLPQLEGKRGVKIYREMSDNDSIIGAILFVIDMLMRSVDWSVEAASDDAADVENADFLSSCLADMSMTFPDVISEIMTMLVFGWEYTEIVYKRRLGPDQAESVNRSQFDDGRIGWHKLPTRAQETMTRWEIDDDGGIRGMWQRNPTSNRDVLIPIERALLFRTNSHKNNPEGRSILRNAYRDWYFKKRIEEIEGIGIERDLGGIPVARIPSSVINEAGTNYQSYKDLVRDVRVDEQVGIVLPSDRDKETGNLLYDFELVSTAGTRAIDTNKVITRHDQRIAMTVVADFIMLGHEIHGSFALSSDKTTLFTGALGAWLDMIAATFNRCAVPRLFALNGVARPPEGWPVMNHGDIEKRNFVEVADALGRLAVAGMPIFPDATLEQWVREEGDLPLGQDEPL